LTGSDRTPHRVCGGRDSALVDMALKTSAAWHLYSW